MEHTSYSICHPRQLQAKASSLVSSLLGGRYSATEMGEYLYSLAASNPEYTRTTALLLRFMLSELDWRDSTACEALRRHVADIAVSRFISWWMREFSTRKEADDTNDDDDDAETVAGIDYLKDIDSIEAYARATPPIPLTTVTAILGDLFAVNVITAQAMRSSVFYLLKNLRFTPHYNEACKLLTRACSHLAPSFGLKFLLECRILILGYIRPESSSLEWCSEMENIMAKISHALARDIEPGVRGVGRYFLSRHHWDRGLSLATLFDPQVVELPRAMDSDMDLDSDFGGVSPKE